jgi:glutamate dehydrogenase (NAD(P)+)
MNPPHDLKQFSLTIEGRNSAWTGYLAVDSIINGKSTGGIRMMPNVGLEELKDLARAMTLKYGFLGIPSGGAKAGIIADPEMDPSEKRSILFEFGSKLSPLIKTGIYDPGMDMGIGPEDLRCIHEAAGLKKSKQLNQISHARTGLYTSFSVLAATQASLQHHGLNFDKCTAAIEGFGNVGGSLASCYAERGVKVIAVSTVRGAVYDYKGLDVGKLQAAYRRYRSDMIDKVDGEKIQLQDLIALPVDILSPCAQAYSITSKNVNQITAKIITPGSNCAVTRDAEEMLYQKGILSIPFFAANCGGALGGTMEFLGCTESQIFNYIYSEIAKKVSNMIVKAEKDKGRIYELAEQEAFNKFAMMGRVQKKSLKSKAVRIAMEMYKANILPVYITRRIVPRYLKSRFWADSMFMN